MGTPEVVRLELNSEDTDLPTLRGHFQEVERVLDEYSPAHTDPDHYREGRRYETWDVIVDWGLGFLAGNVVKYISRMGRKGGDNTRLSDLHKARNYIDRLIKEEEEGGDRGPSG